MKKVVIALLVLALQASVLVQPVAADTAGKIDVKAVGATGGGVADDTDAIQNALDNYKTVCIPDGTYMINPDKALFPQSNQTIILSAGAVLKAIPSARSYNNVFLISGVNNVTITGGTIIGERKGHLGTDGEWGSGILISSGSSNITLSHMTIEDCWGDALEVGDGKISRNIKIDHVVADGNRRAGLSVCFATNVTVSNSVFKNASGLGDQGPGSGINMEPDRGCEVSNLTLTNDVCSGNATRGFSFSGYNGTLKNVTITNCSAYRNTFGMFIETVNNLSCSESSFYKNGVGVELLRDTAEAKFSKVNVHDNNSFGFELSGNEQKKGTVDVIFSDSTFFNNSQQKTGRFDGVRIFSDGSGYIRNVSFAGCSFYDVQKKPTQRCGMTLGSKVQKVSIDKFCTFYGNAVQGLKQD